MTRTKLTKTVNARTGEPVPFPLVGLQVGRYVVRDHWQATDIDRRRRPGEGIRSERALPKGTLIRVERYMVDRPDLLVIIPRGWFRSAGLVVKIENEGHASTTDSGLYAEDVQSLVSLLDPDDSHKGWMATVDDGAHAWSYVVERLLSDGVVTREQISAAYAAEFER